MTAKLDLRKRLVGITNRLRITDAPVAIADGTLYARRGSGKRASLVYVYTDATGASTVFTRAALLAQLPEMVA